MASFVCCSLPPAVIHAAPNVSLDLLQDPARSPSKMPAFLQLSRTIVVGKHGDGYFQRAAKADSFRSSTSKAE
jgi:hypothetical protein